MAKVFLNSGESFTLANSAEVYGAAGTGTEKVLLTGAATAITTDQNIERVELSGNVSAYTFQVVGNQVKVYSGTTLVTTIGVQGDADGTKVAFADGSADLKITGLNAATLGGQAVSSASATAITGATLNATDKSATAGSTGTTTPGVGQAFTLTTAATDTLILTTGNDTVTGAAGTVNTGDLISDGSTTDNDVLNATLSSGTIKPTVTNVENINLDFKGFNIIYDATNTSNGLITASSTQDGNNKASFQGLTSSTKVAIGTGISTVDLLASGTTLSLGSLKLGGGALTIADTAGNTTGTFNIESLKAANTLTVGTSFSTAAILNVTGDQNLTIKGSAGSLPTTVTKTLTNNAKLTADLTTVTTADLSKVAADSFVINSGLTDNNNAVLTLASTAGLAINTDLGANSHSVVATGSGTSDTLNLTLSAGQTISAGKALTIDSYETVNINVTTALNPGMLVFTGANALNATLTGSGDVTFSGAATTSTITLAGGVSGGFTLDASNLNGKLVFGDTGLAAVTGPLTAGFTATKVTVSGTAKDDIFVGAATGATYVGGAGNDTFYSCVAADTIVGGSGNDTVNVLSVATGPFNLAGGDGIDTLAFGATGNTLSATMSVSTAGLSIGTSDNITGFETIVANVSSGAVSITLNDAATSAGATTTIKVKQLSSTSGTLKIDGSAEKDGKLIIDAAGSLTTSAVTLTGGLGDDVIYSVSGTGASATVTGGKGVDTIVLASSGTDKVVFTSGDSGITVSTADSVSGFSTGDKLIINAGTAALSSTDLGSDFSITNGVATYTGSSVDALNAFITAATNLGKSGGTIVSKSVAFVSGADTYVYYLGASSSVNTDDGLIKLVGTTVTDLSTILSAS